MSTPNQIAAALADMKRRQRSAFDEERHLRIAHSYMAKHLRKPLEDFDLDSIDIESDGICCNIQIWVRYRDDMADLMAALEADHRKWRPSIAGFSSRHTFEYCLGSLKGMIALSVHCLMDRPATTTEDAAMPQKQEL